MGTVSQGEADTHGVQIHATWSNTACA